MCITLEIIDDTQQAAGPHAETEGRGRGRRWRGGAEVNRRAHHRNHPEDLHGLPLGPVEPAQRPPRGQEGRRLHIRQRHPEATIRGSYNLQPSLVEGVS